MGSGAVAGEVTTEGRGWRGHCWAVVTGMGCTCTLLGALGCTYCLTWGLRRCCLTSAHCSAAAAMAQALFVCDMALGGLLPLHATRTAHVQATPLHARNSHSPSAGNTIVYTHSTLTAQVQATTLHTLNSHSPSTGNAIACTHSTCTPQVQATLLHARMPCQGVLCPAARTASPHGRPALRSSATPVPL